MFKGRIHPLALYFSLSLSKILVAPASLNDTKTLFKYLFEDNGYDTRVIPIDNQTDTLFVYVNPYLIRINDIDEVKETMTTLMYLYMGWYDDNLKWDTTMFNDIDHIHVPQFNVWKPEIPLENGVSKMTDLGDPVRLMLVMFDGLVYWWPFEVLTTKCAIDIRYYPFDKQTCNIIFGLWTYTSTEIDVLLYASEIDMSEYQTNGQWDIIRTSAIKSYSNGQTAITFSITMKRKPQYILSSVALPIMMLSILSAFTFVLPIDCGEKMGYSMTLYLAFAVFLTIVSSTLPQRPTMSLMSLYLIILLINGTIINMIVALQIRIHYWDRSRKIPLWMRHLVQISWKLQCRRSVNKIRPCSNTKQNEMPDETNINKMSIQTIDVDDLDSTSPPPVLEPESSKAKIAWPDVTSAMDFFCFWIFLSTTVLVTVLLFAIGYLESEKQELPQVQS